MMRREQLYIDGEWVEATGEGVIEVTNPATEEIIGSVPVGVNGRILSVLKRKFVAH